MADLKMPEINYVIVAGNLTKDPIFRETIDKEHLAIDDAKELILNACLAKKGDLIIFTAGAPYSEKSRANWLRFEVI